MNAHTNPRQFGRKVAPAPITREQQAARFAAVASFLLFAVALAGGLVVSSPGASAWLVTIAFLSLFVGMCAAHEAKGPDAS